MDEFRKSVNAQQHMRSIPIGNNGVIRITEIDLKPEMPNRIQCEEDKVIRVESATLTNKDFDSKCQVNTQIKNENLNILNETCVEEGQQAFRIVSSS